MLGFHTITDFERDRDLITRGRYGVIELVDDQLTSIRLRPFPTIVPLSAAFGLGDLLHRWRPGNRCRLYYNQPQRFPQFLALRFVESQAQTTLRTFRGALVVLDEIARWKGCDAILADVMNLRISSRLLARWGWESHRPTRWHRHYIKRFYGQYPPAGEALALLAPSLQPDLLPPATAATIPPFDYQAATADFAATAGR